MVSFYFFKMDPSLFFNTLNDFLGETNNAVKFSDPKVCKSFLVGCCPHDILATTVSISHAHSVL